MGDTIIVKKVVVFCTLQFEGTHNWPECPFDEVAYLRSPHRHVFYIKAYKNVNHTDRDVEFIMLKHRIAEYLKEQFPSGEFGSSSCEMIASELCTVFGLTKCEVSEDGENGAIVEYCSWEE